MHSCRLGRCCSQRSCLKSKTSRAPLSQAGRLLLTHQEIVFRVPCPCRAREAVGAEFASDVKLCLESVSWVSRSFCLTFSIETCFIFSIFYVLNHFSCSFFSSSAMRSRAALAPGFPSPNLNYSVLGGNPQILPRNANQKTNVQNLKTLAEKPTQHVHQHLSNLALRVSLTQNDQQLSIFDQ